MTNAFKLNAKQTKMTSVDIGQETFLLLLNTIRSVAFRFSC